LRPALDKKHMKAKLILLFAALMIAWALKRHYSDARADHLLWILTPTAHLVGVASGVSFTLEPGEGYFSRERLFLIEKSCAGVNFMIAAFLMLACALVHHVRSVTSVFRVLGISLVAAYCGAVLTNAVRITLAMWLAAHPALLSAFTPSGVHRVEGIVVYFGALVVLFEMTQRLDRVAAAGSRS
jgi:exosortase K